MVDRITFTVPGPPRAQARPRFGNGRAYKDAQSRANETTIAVLAQQAMAGRAPIEGPCKVTVLAVYPVAASWSKIRKANAVCGIEKPTRKPDCDNICKAVCDGMNAIVYPDDAAVVRLVMSKEYGPAGDVGVHVTVEAI